MTDDRYEITWANNPADDVAWCRERGHRAHTLVPAPATYTTPGLLISYGANVIGVAEPGDILRFDGHSIRIYTPSKT